MSTRSALAGAVSTTVVLAALGNPTVVEEARDEGSLLATSVTGFATWDVADAAGDVIGLIALRLGVTIVVAGLLSGLAGRSRSRPAAWLVGWGAVVVAAALGGAAGYVYQVEVVLDGTTYAATWADGLVGAANSGATFGLWTGWLVGVLVAVATRPVPAPAVPGVAWAAPVDELGAPVAGETSAGRVADPPPPWWAPTAGTTDAGLRPGPTAFPPGGFGPVVPGVGEPVPPIPAPRPGASHEMRTASGDPHPSDPDATQAVGLPPDTAAAGDGDRPGPEGPSAPTVPADDRPADDRTAVGDPDTDATATIEPPVPGDHTAQIPRNDV